MNIVNTEMSKAMKARNLEARASGNALFQTKTTRRPRILCRWERLGFEMIRKVPAVASREGILNHYAKVWEKIFGDNICHACQAVTQKRSQGKTNPPKKPGEKSCRCRQPNVDS